MFQNTTVAEYLGQFRDAVSYVPTLTPDLQVKLFHTGLTDFLKPLCLVNHFGQDFITLDEIKTHTLGEDRKLKLTAHLKHRPTGTNIPFNRPFNRPYPSP